MSVAARVFRGFGNGTVIGTVNERVHRGYVAGAAASNFIGVGVLMYSKDDKYYIHSDPPTITIT